MKKVFYVLLALVVIAGLSVGLWFMRATPSDNTEKPIEETVDMSQKPVSQAPSEISSLAHLEPFFTSVPALTKAQSATYAVLFAPTQKATEDFVKETALTLEKFLSYHIVYSEQPVTITEGAKLRTEDGQEVVIVSVGGDLYVRDAKGRDARLRKPVQASNGVVYIIDKVLLTQ